MRHFIRWIFIEEIGKFIRNNENNENWPAGSTFAEMVFQKWQTQIDNQQKEINLLEAKNNQTRELMTEVQKWFIEEHNLLSKPAKRAWLQQKDRLKRLERELKLHQHNLDHPKLELEEYEKRCLLKKIEIGKRKIGSCKDDLAKAEEAYEKEKRELCQRLAYEKEDIPAPFLRNPEERIDPITRKLVINHEDYSKWWRIGKEIDEESKPLEELRKRIDEWYEHNEGKGPEYNPYEIWVEEKTDDSITFLWKPVETEQEGKDGKKVKGVYLPLLKNYLFNYYGEWYEVSNHYQVNYNSIAINASKSIFYNYYHLLLISSVCGIFHHSQTTLVTREEICSCPNYEFANRFREFGSTYKLKLALYKMDGKLLDTGGIVKDEDLKMIATPDVKLVEDPKKDTKDMWNYFNPYNMAGMIKEGWDSLKDALVGTIYFLLSERLKDWAYNETTFRIGSGEKDGGVEKIQWKEIEKSGGKGFFPTGPDINKWLEGYDLLDPDNEHFLEYHPKATLYWRKKQIWQGRYYLIHKDFVIKEFVNPAGTTINIFGNAGILIGRVTESVTAKIGGNNLINKFVECVVDTTLSDDKGQNNRQTERNVISESSVNGGETKKKETKTKQTVSSKTINNDNGPSFGSTLLRPHTYAIDHTKCEYTMYQFQSRYRISGTYPLSLRVELNEALVNQYKMRKAIKGKMTYDYFNSVNFGEHLEFEGFLKASVISMNMETYSNWFREKIEAGVNLWKKDHLQFYTKKLPDKKSQGSRGGTSTGTWKQLQIRTNKQTTVVPDWQVGKDNMTWVEMGSYCRPDGGGNNIFPQLITDPAGSSALKMTVPPHSADSSSCPYKSGGYCTGSHVGSWRFDCDKSWTGKKHYLSKGVRYEYRITILGMTDAYGMTADDDDSGVFAFQDRNKIGIQQFGNVIIDRTINEPEGLPSSSTLPATGITPATVPATPFNPNQFPQSGNLMPNPTGSGEQEFNVPDIDNDHDPDFAQDFDTDIGKDVDTGQDTDITTDNELPIDKGDDDDND